MTIFSLSQNVYYDHMKERYRNVLVIDRTPIGALTSITRRVNFAPLSPFQYIPSANTGCKYVIIDPTDKMNFLEPSNIATLYTYLLSNGCTINTDITNMTFASKTQPILNLICFITVL